MEQSDKNPVILGQVSGLYGVRGWVKVYSYTEPRDAILNYRAWQLQIDGDWQSVNLEEGRKQGKTIVARLQAVTERDVAAGLVGADIGVNREDLPETNPDEYYWNDLVGMEVVNSDNRCIGKVSHLLATGANDVLVVKGEEEILLPFVTGDVIEDVDLAAGTIRVNWEWD